MYSAFLKKILSAIGSTLACMTLAHAQATAAQPATIGNVTFIVGDAQLDRNGTVTALTKGQALQVGDRLLTGANGHVHARMIDNGFISVRPSGRLHIQSYTYTPQDPGANRVGLMLESGVARTISGKAGEAAREHYRFNTPVAAIGLRGTDYVVQALPDATRVSVLKGAVTLSPFGPGCQSGSLAPCTGPLVRELAAGSPHAYMEVRAQGGFPVIVMPDQGKDAPNKVAPPRPEEVGVTTERQLSNALTANLLHNSTNAVEAQAKVQADADALMRAQAQTREREQATARAQAAAEALALQQQQEAAAQAKADTEAAAAAAQAKLEAQTKARVEAAALAAAKAQAEAAALATAQAEAAALAKTRADAAAALALANAPKLPVINAPTAPRTQIVWGRWSGVALAGTPTITSVSAPDREIAYSNDLFGMLRPTESIRFPSAGVISMNYLQGEAYLQVQQPGAVQQLTPASLSAASLQLDFNTRQFATRLNATASTRTYELQAQGSIHAQGLLMVDAARSNINLAGALSNNAQEAGYLFDVNVAPNQNLVGVTRWGR